jgi:hypothetical protein
MMVRMRIPTPSASVVLSAVALFAALGGSGYAATQVGQHNGSPGVGYWSHPDAGQDQAQIYRLAPSLSVGYLGGRPASAYASARSVVNSGGERFLTAGQTVTLARVGHFTFSATCSKVGGGNQVSVDVVADTVAGLDGNAPAPAGTSVNIHMNSDDLDTTPDNPLANGDFDQVGSASSSTEIAQDGQEVDVFYNDGVNGFGHDCFAGITGLLAP